MPLFGRKPNIDPEEFCRLYAETQVIALWSDPQQPIAIVQKVGPDDPAFARVDAHLLGEELVALNLELFGLAWIHQVRDGKRQVVESAAMKRYLTEVGRAGTWEMMGAYNQAIARSSKKGLPEGERLQRAAVVGQNSARLGLLEEWTKDGIEDDAAVRAVNRFFTDRLWEKATKFYVVYNLLERLGLATEADGPLVDETTSGNLAALVDAMYQTARASVKAANM